MYVYAFSIEFIKEDSFKLSYVKRYIDLSKNSILKNISKCNYPA